MKNILVSLLGVLVGVTSLGFIKLKRKKNEDGSSSFDFSLFEIEGHLESIDVYTKDTDEDGNIDFDEIILIDPDRNVGLTLDMRFVGTYKRQKDGTYFFMPWQDPQSPDDLP